MSQIKLPHRTIVNDLGGKTVEELEKLLNDIESNLAAFGISELQIVTETNKHEVVQSQIYQKNSMLRNKQAKESPSIAQTFKTVERKREKQEKSDMDLEQESSIRSVNTGYNYFKLRKSMNNFPKWQDGIPIEVSEADEKTYADKMNDCCMMMGGRPPLSKELIKLISQEAYNNAYVSLAAKNRPKCCGANRGCGSKKGYGGVSVNWCSLLGLGGGSRKVGRRRRH